MIKFIIKHFVKDYENVDNLKVRERYGVLAGVLGIICNSVLFVLKLVIGWLMGSIAIISDAFNNLSDMGSSIISIISTRLSNQKPDKEHPFGHGRIEYVASLIVAFMIIFVSIELFRNSLDKIINPVEVTFDWILFGILCASILVKVWMFIYNRYIGKKINSSVANATATDSRNDVVSTSIVILSLVIGHYVQFPVDGIMGLIVSILIFISGIDIAKGTISTLLGNPPSKETVEKIQSVVRAGKGIIGTHDLMVHDYGPGRIFSSIHAEVPDDVNIVEVHEVIDAIEEKVYDEMGITLTIHMDPISLNNSEVIDATKVVLDTVHAIDPNTSIHDFRMVHGDKQINLIFDLVVPYNITEKETELIKKGISDNLMKIDKRYRAVMKIEHQMYEGEE